MHLSVVLDIPRNNGPEDHGQLHGSAYPMGPTLTPMVAQLLGETLAPPAA